MVEGRMVMCDPVVYELVANKRTGLLILLRAIRSRTGSHDV